MGTHQNQTQAKGIHPPARWLWADSTARLAETDVVQFDVDYGSVGLQLSDNTLWRATDTAPTWVQVGGSGVASNEHVVTSAAGDTDLAAVALSRNTSGTPAPGLGVREEFTIDSDSNPDVQAGDIGFVWVSEAEPTQQALFFAHVYYGSDRIPVMVINAEGVTPDTLANIIANLGAGAVHIGAVSDATLSALGQQSFVLAGDGTNKTDAARAGTLGGGNNQAAGNDSIAMGFGALASYDQAFAQAGGYFAARGDCNTNRVPIKASTPNNTPAVLRLCAIPANTHFGFSLNVVARRVTGTTQGAYYKRRGSGYTGASLGTITLTSIVTEGTDVEDDAAWDLTVTVDGGDNSLHVVGTGAAADTVYWGGMLEIWWVSG